MEWFSSMKLDAPCRVIKFRELGSIFGDFREISFWEFTVVDVYSGVHDMDDECLFQLVNMEWVRKTS